MKNKILMTLFIAAMLMTVSCSGGTAEETEGTADIGTVETAGAETSSAETDAAETEAAETTVVPEQYDYVNNDLTPYITLGNYKGLEVTTKSAELTDAEYDAQVAALLASFADFEKVTDRAVQEGETVVTSYKGYKDGVAFDGGTSESSEVTAADGTGYIDGFGSAFIGQMPGVEFSFNVTFPDNYGSAELAGQEVTFYCTISHIKGEKITPELTDEFVLENYDFANVEEFHTAFRDYNAESKAYEIESAMHSEMWDMILADSVVIDYPEGEIDYYFYMMKNEMEQYAAMYGYSYEDFILASTGMAAEVYEETAKEQAKLYVKENLVIYQIAKEENITITEEAFNAEVAALAEMNGVSADVILQYYGEENLRLSLLQELVFAAITEYANVTVETGAAETSAAEQE